MLKIFLFGTPEIRRHGEPVGSFRSRKAAALLYYLAAVPGPQPREQLADLLWDAPSTEQAFSNLRTALTYLRRELDTYLVVTQESLALDRRSRHQIDLDEFTTAIAAISPDGPLSPLAAARVEQALDWHRGPFLDGFSVPNAPRFDEWLLVQRERHQGQAAALAGRLVDHYEMDHQWAAAIRAAQRWLALDPLSEAAHVALMRALARDGQRAAALAQYEALVEMLDEEFGVGPGPQAEALQAQIESGTVQDQAGGTRPATPPLLASGLPESAIPHNLGDGLRGHYGTAFVGRESELARLDALLADRATRLITIVGTGGMGKTRLATEIAGRQLTATAGPGRSEPRFPQGVFFVPLAPLEHADQLVRAIAEAIGLSLSDAAGAPPADRQLLDYLRRRRMLLLLDNAEHLLDERPAVNTLLVRMVDTAPRLHLLVTSREPLEAMGETALVVEGLAGTELTEDDPLLAVKTPAVRLFLSAARRVRPDYALTEADLPRVLQLARLLGGMPLAIELAAAWVDALSPSELLAEIEQNATALSSLAGDAPERQRNMRAVFDHSWRRLSEAEQELFRRLSLFRDGFTTEAAAAIAAGPARLTLAALAKKSLLAFRPDSSRYEMHELLRQFAAEKLASDPELEAALRDQLTDYYTRWLAEEEAGLRGGRQRETLLAVAADLENIRRAWRWAAERQNAAALDRALFPLHSHFYPARGFQVAGAEECRLALDGLRGASELEERRVLARLLGEAAQYAYFAGRMEEAARLRDECRAELEALAAKELDLRAVWAFLEREQGKALRMSDLAGSRAAYERSLTLFREVGDTWNVTMTLSWLADVVGRMGDERGRVATVEEALTLQETAGDRRGASFSLAYLSGNTLVRGRLAEARSLARRGLTYSLELDEHTSASLARHQQGIIARLSGDFEEAQALLAVTLSEAEQAGHYVQIKDNLLELGRLALAQQSFTTAGDWFGRARRLGRERNMPPTICDAGGYQALALLYSGRVAEAVNLLEETVAQAEAGGYGRGEQRWRGALALASVHAGNAERAGQLLAQPVDDHAATAARLTLWATEAKSQPREDWSGRIQAAVEPVQQHPFLRRQHDLARAEALAGVVLACAGQQSEAVRHLRSGVRGALAGRAFVPLLYALAGALLLQPHQEAWRELLGRHPFPAASAWFAELVDPLHRAPGSLPSLAELEQFGAQLLEITA